MPHLDEIPLLPTAGALAAGDKLVFFDGVSGRVATALFSELNALFDLSPRVPTLLSATLDGGSLVLVFSEDVARGAGFTESNVNLEQSVTGATYGVYVSGDGTATWEFLMDDPAVAADVVTLDYATTANGIEDTAGNDLAAIVGFAVTNNTAP